MQRGFALFQNPVLRKTMARAITIEQACRREGVDLAGLMGELRQLAEMDRVRFVSITHNCRNGVTSARTII